LLEVSGALAALQKRLPFVLRVIGGGSLDIPGVQVEVFKWTLESEAELVRDSDVGIMPLRNGPWELGKCAYKLIQCMGSGLPTVSSPVGANRDVVVDGVTGLFASTEAEWADQLEKLLLSVSLREEMGRAARLVVVNKYCLQVGASALFSEISGVASAKCAV
jgi:glycosyltransferase involved in cell wall biosynthesis